MDRIHGTADIQSNIPTSDTAPAIPAPATSAKPPRVTGALADLQTLRDNRPVSQAHIGGRSYKVGPNTTPAVKQFLSRTLSNNRYESPAHLQTRAENYLRHRDAEQNILRATTEGLEQPESAVFKQTAWMGHLERGLWHGETRFGGNDREQLGQEALGNVTPQPGSPFHGPRGLKLSDRARSAFAMTLQGVSGPFTKDQARAGFEVAQTGQVLAGRLKIDERVIFRRENRVDAQRNGTHSTRTHGGMDLSQDLGTAMRDEVGLPVMSGTSGSSSDAAIATRFAAERAEKSPAAPDLSEAEGRKAITDLSHHYFRASGSSPPESMANGINKIRAEADLEEMEVDTLDIFTHSYPEIHAGVALTLAKAPGTDITAMREATQ
ncbi:secretion protein EspV [Robbsia andropogonis]|uniref:secretion protein EspV n=1 Tax=Robbsia andropogonis TaxID=28092 RepID=UPI000AF1BEA4|nr:secretion protein EspV [Robbsia andropogonis]